MMKKWFQTAGQAALEKKSWWLHCFCYFCVRFVGVFDLHVVAYCSILWLSGSGFALIWFRPVQSNANKHMVSVMSVVKFVANDFHLRVLGILFWTGLCYWCTLAGWPSKVCPIDVADIVQYIDTYMYIYISVIYYIYRKFTHITFIYVRIHIHIACMQNIHIYIYVYMYMHTISYAYI